MKTVKVNWFVEQKGKWTLDETFEEDISKDTIISTKLQLLQGKLDPKKREALEKRL